MTTTIDTSPESVGRTAADAVRFDHKRPESRTKPRLGRLISATVAALIVGGGAWVAIGWSRSATGVTDTNRFTVEPRTFNVVLKEKGELQAAKSTDIICEVEGRSTIISLAEEGTAVQAGDLLVELASDAIEERIRETELKEANAITAYEAADTELDIQRDKNASDVRKAQLRIELSRLELEKYEQGEWQETQKDAAINIDRAKIMLERRTEDYAAAKELYARQFITQTEFKEDEFNHQKAIWDLEKAEKAKEVLEKYTHVADLRQRQSDLEEAVKEAQRTEKNAVAEETKKTRDAEGKRKELDLIQDKLAKLRIQKEKCRITAPGPGFVVYYTGGGGWRMQENQIREGAEVRERQVLMQLPDTSSMIVVVRIHEAKTDRLALGQRAVVEVEGLPGLQLTATVSKIAALADTQNRWLNPDLKEYETEITLDEVDVPLKPGGTAHVEILVQTVDEVLAVPVQSVYSRAGHRYVFENTRRGVEPVEVKLGALGIEWAEVTDGLSPDRQILLAFSDEHTRLLPDDRRANRRDGGHDPRPQSARRKHPDRAGKDTTREHKRARSGGPSGGGSSSSKTSGSRSGTQ